MPPKAAAPAAKPAAKPAAAAPKAVKNVKYIPVVGAARQLTSVRKFDESNKTTGSIVQPAVFVAPIRPDIVHFVHYNMAKNSRQAYSVNVEAGHQHSAHSWGTGRAVSRIPRVSGGGTSRAGQGAFGNMCRQGRMFAPTKIWRKWHRKINTNQKRFAVASALAASALPSLVLARGHRVEQVPEIPLVVESELESITRTKQAIAALKAVGAYADVEKAKASRKLRAGKGKMRNRRHVNRRGPLVVFKNDNGIVRAFRNLPGVEIANVNSLNLLQLAPGGHLGRFVVWTKDAFAQLNANWGSFTRVSSQKSGYTLPRPMMTNSDLTRLINSDEIQSRVRAPVKSIHRFRNHKNPLTNLGVKIKLNPYALTMRRAELLKLARAKKQAAAVAEAKKTGKALKRNAIVVKTEQKLKTLNKTHRQQRQAVNYARILDHEAGSKLAKELEAKKPKAAPKAAAAAPKKK